MGAIVKRTFDIVTSAVCLVLTLPLSVIAAVIVVIGDPGPVFYRAQRVGLNGRNFGMHKFRTMVIAEGPGSAITGHDDPRFFRGARLLRLLKLDELPQLWDVLRGRMSVVGPRPEDPMIVEQHYTDDYRTTLTVRPGLTSPGSVYYFAHAEDLLKHGSAEEAYIRDVLPVKMALDQYYVNNLDFVYDLRLIFRTLIVIVKKAWGGSVSGETPELDAVDWRVKETTDE